MQGRVKQIILFLFPCLCAGELSGQSLACKCVVDYSHSLRLIEDSARSIISGSEACVFRLVDSLEYGFYKDQELHILIVTNFVHVVWPEKNLEYYLSVRHPAAALSTAYFGCQVFY